MVESINTNPNSNRCDLHLLPDIYNTLQLTGDVLEFGTFTGNSSIHLAQTMPNHKIYTIDHFLGLEQTNKARVSDWYEGAFALGRPEYMDQNSIPKSVEELKQKISPYKNLQLIESDVHKLEHHDNYGIGQIGLVNIDVDIYEPTVSSLEFLTKCKWERIFIRFDDWHGDEPEFYEHERLAFAEWVTKYGYQYQITHGGYIGGVIVSRSEKVRVKKMAGTWGEYECSSNRNLPKTMEWIPMNSYESCEHKIYIDENIMKIGIFEPGDDKIGWLLESPQINTETISWILNNLDQIKKHYKYVFTCIDSLLALGAPFAYTISNAVPWIWMENRKIYKKTKLVSMIASNKGIVKGHQNRLEWVERLKDKVDLFGTGRPNQLIDKEDGLRDYMFSVSIENDDSDTYFTEKLTDNFVMGTVPVFWGSRKVIDKYFDVRGVIFLEDDPTLSTVTSETYESMKPYIEENFKRAMELPISEDYICETYLKN